MPNETITQKEYLFRENRQVFEELEQENAKLSERIYKLTTFLAKTFHNPLDATSQQMEQLHLMQKQLKAMKKYSHCLNDRMILLEGELKSELAKDPSLLR